MSADPNTVALARSPHLRITLLVRALRKAEGQRVSAASAVVIALIFLACLFAPLIAPHPGDAGDATHVDQRLLAPSARHLFGTDDLGRDVLTRTLYGGRSSIEVAAIAVGIAAAFGIAVGVLAAYRGGWIDEVLMRFSDVFLGVPSLVLIMLVSITLGGGSLMTALAIAVSTWPLFARLTRGEIMRTKALGFVEAAYACGASPVRIVRRHLLRPSMPVLVAETTLLFGRAVLVTAALGFLGLGARPPAPDWGVSIAEGQNYLPQAWWISLFPGLAVVIFVVGLSLIGDATRVRVDFAEHR